MTSNRFSDCIDIGGVLRLYRNWKSGGDMKPVHADAVARIAELSRTPVVVDEETRERVLNVVEVDRWKPAVMSEHITDRILGELGYLGYVGNSPSAARSTRANDALTESKPHPVFDPVSNIDVGVVTLRTLSNLADWFYCRQYPDRIDVTVDGVSATIYRDEKLRVHVRIGAWDE